MEAIIDIDLAHSTTLSNWNSGLNLFAAFHAAVDSTFGEPWSRGGDGVIVVVPDLASAVRQALEFQEKLVNANAHLPLPDTPLFARVAIHVNQAQPSLLAVQPEARGQLQHDDVSRAAHLQKQSCPTGRILISEVAYKELGKQLEELFRPTPSGKFFLQKKRALMPQEKKFASHLSDRQQSALPALSFLSWKLITPTSMTLNTVWKLLDEDLVVVYGDSGNQRGVLHPAATSDAIGMTELARYAHRDVAAGIDEWEDTADLVTSRTALIVGSGTANMYANAINSVYFPLRFVAGEDNRIHGEIVADDQSKGDDEPGKKTYYGRHGSTGGIYEHAGLVIVSKSIFNLDKSLVWVAGTTGMGTQAAMAFLRDLLLRKVPAGLETQAIGAVVTPHVPNGRVGEYFKRWRIADYSILHQIDANGHKLVSARSDSK